MTDSPKSKKFDWARSQNSYIDKFTNDTRHQIIIILPISFIRDIYLVAIIFFEFPECTQTRKIANKLRLL